MDATAKRCIAVYLVVLGAGIDCPCRCSFSSCKYRQFEDPASQTSGVTFFRVVGASFGTATRCS